MTFKSMLLTIFSILCASIVYSSKSIAQSNCKPGNVMAIIGSPLENHLKSVLGGHGLEPRKTYFALDTGSSEPIRVYVAPKPPHGIYGIYQGTYLKLDRICSNGVKTTLHNSEYNANVTITKRQRGLVATINSPLGNSTHSIKRVGVSDRIEVMGYNRPVRKPVVAQGPEAPPSVAPEAIDRLISFNAEPKAEIPPAPTKGQE